MIDCLCLMLLLLKELKKKSNIMYYIELFTKQKFVAVVGH